MKKAISLGIISVLALAMLAGCADQQQNGGGYTGGPTGGKPAQKPVVNFEGIVSSVEDGTVTLEDGTVVLITDDTDFGGDPDSTNVVSEDIQPGNFIQGYTEDALDADQLTAKSIWANLPQSSGKLRINFEGQVAQVADDSVTLEDGTVVLVSEQTVVKSFDGSVAEIAVGDYIQGYAADPSAAELEALNILVTIL